MNIIDRSSFENELTSLVDKRAQTILAIDGLSCSGKTTYANILADKFKASIVRLDDFFLSKQQRTSARLKEIGGNIDYERFQEEVLKKLNDDYITYRPFNCQTFEYKEAVTVKKSKLLILEGSYAHHPYFRKYLDYLLFLNISPLEQRKRVIKRNGERANQFFELWIPKENAYFEKFQIADRADWLIEDVLNQ